MKLLCLFSIIFFVSAFATDRIFRSQMEITEQECINNNKDIAKKLACLNEITFKENLVSSVTRGVRIFEIQITQPVDHTQPDGQKFSQKLVLMHRNESEPMVLQTSGYSIFGIREAAITSVFKTNQLQVEHRFFSKSIPENADWTLLNIKQSADDFHKITQTFKKIYGANWVNTGASKGGMTSIYHRYFYPNDLDGTIADVAPLSFSTRDQRYNTFIENVGGDEFQKCREDLKVIQKELLKNRDVHVPKLQGKFDFIGGADVAFEHATVELSFVFWQYGNPGVCSILPPSGNTEGQFSFLKMVNNPEGYSDGNLNGFMPYYFQAATQLGSPDSYTAHLELLRRYEYDIDQYTPKNLTYSYSNSEMRKVSEWVKTEADKVIFVYGEFDPWTAGEFPVSETGKDVSKYMVPRANHGANFKALLDGDKSSVIASLTTWLGKAPQSTQVLNQENVAPEFKIQTLEDLEFQYRRKIKK